jgi:hypothetical protein
VFKNKIILNFVKFVATKRVLKKIFPSSLLVVVGSGTRNGKKSGCGGQDEQDGSATLVTGF